MSERHANRHAAPKARLPAYRAAAMTEKRIN